jgi:hypothetical protein
MGIVTKRLMKSFGRRGMITMICAAGTLGLVIASPSFLKNGGDTHLLILGAIGTGGIIFCTRGYRRPRATGRADEIVPVLLGSTEEFGLILRPFGADGEIVLDATNQPRQHYRSSSSVVPYRRTLTLEQVIAKSAADVLGQRAYALVDQTRTFAPPGPAYMRAPLEDWRGSVSALIRRAFFIFIILPPNQELRDSFTWEIEQIVLNGLQTRTVIVLPPEDQDPAGFTRAVSQAAVLTATMETASGKESDALSIAIWQYETEFTASRSFMMAFRRDPGNLSNRLRHWTPVDPPDRRRLRLRRKKKPVVVARTYSDALQVILAGTKNELAGKSFSDRYPYHQAAAG